MVNASQKSHTLHMNLPVKADVEIPQLYYQIATKVAFLDSIFLEIVIWALIFLFSDCVWTLWL